VVSSARAVTESTMLVILNSLTHLFRSGNNGEAQNFLTVLFKKYHPRKEVIFIGETVSM
jgi:hypothetical protein